MGVKYVDVRPQITAPRTIRLNSDKIPEIFFREQIADQMARTFAKELVLLNQLRLIFGDDVEEELFKLERLERRLALPR